MSSHIEHEQGDRRIIPGRAPETNELIALLRPRPIGTILTYEELSGHIRKDVTNGARSYLSSARRYLLRNERAVWGTVRGEGIKRLTDIEIVTFAKSEMKGAARRMRRSRDAAMCANYGQLPEESRREHNAIAMATSITRLFTTETGQRKLRDALPVANNATLPEPRDTLALFAKR